MNLMRRASSEPVVVLENSSGITARPEFLGGSYRHDIFATVHQLYIELDCEDSSVGGSSDGGSESVDQSNNEEQLETQPGNSK